MTAQDIRPILKYAGSKWRLAPWISSYFPAYRTYVEPYFGSGAVFFNLAPAEYEIINDLSGNIVNLFRTIRTRGNELAALIQMTPWSREEYYESYQETGDSLEDARRFLVRCWQAHGTRLNQRTGWRNRGSADGGATTSLWRQLPDRLLAIVERLQMVEIENLPAVDIIARYKDQSDCLIYCDPPYVLETRGKRKLYEEEMSDQDHMAMLDLLDQCRGPVVISGYAHSLYDDRLAAEWSRVMMSTAAEKGQTRTEVLWLNEKANHRQLNLFEEGIS